MYASDLARAVETAQIAFDRTGIPVRQDRRLRECNYGALNGAPVTKLAAQRRRRIREPLPDGESCQQVVDRTRDFLTDLVRDRDGHRVLVIAHSANRWALEVLILGKALDDLVDAPFAWQPGWHYLVSSSGFGVRQEGGGV